MHCLNGLSPRASRIQMDLLISSNDCNGLLVEHYHHRKSHEDFSSTFIDKVPQERTSETQQSNLQFFGISVFRLVAWETVGALQGWSFLSKGRAVQVMATNCAPGKPGLLGEGERGDPLKFEIGIQRVKVPSNQCLARRLGARPARGGMTHFVKRRQRARQPHHRASSGVHPAGGHQAERRAARHRDVPRGSGQIQAHR